MSPATIGPYRLGAPLGESGRGMVYRAVAGESARPMAVKVISPDKFADAAARESFLRQARATVEVSHPHLRQLCEVGESGGQFYLAMEYLEGTTLRSLLLGGRVDSNTALAWAAEIADALAALHAAKLVHGDLRPSRVFVTSQGTVKLLEPAFWRVGVPAGVDLTQADAPAGSELTTAAVTGLSPEEVRGGAADARSDLFSLGLVLYQMLAGQHPFAARNARQMAHWILHRPAAPLGELPPLDALLARVLEKDPAARLSDATAFAAALRALAEGEAPPPEVLAPKAAARWAAPLWWAIGALVALAAAWFAYLALTRP